MDFSDLSESDRLRLLRVMEEKQVKDSMRMYNSLVERCFMDCVNDFTLRSLSSKEEPCVNRCADKFLKLSARVGQRFAEQNVLMQQQQQQQQPQQPQGELPATS